MEKASELLNRANKAREDYNEFYELSRRCLATFTLWEIEDIEISVENDWKALYRRFDIDFYDDENIFYLLRDLKSYIINRTQFKEKMSKTIKSIEDERKKLKKKHEEAERDYSLAYDEFFGKNPKKLNGNAKSIFLILSQPEAKKIIREFLK